MSRIAYCLVLIAILCQASFGTESVTAQLERSLLRADSLMQTKQLGEARIELQKALQLLNSSPEGTARLRGEVCWRLGDLALSEKPENLQQAVLYYELANRAFRNGILNGDTTCIFGYRRTLRTLANDYYLQSNLPLADSTLVVLEREQRQVLDSTDMAIGQTLLWRGQATFFLSQYEKAIVCLQNARRIYEAYPASLRDSLLAITLYFLARSHSALWENGAVREIPNAIQCWSDLASLTAQRGNRYDLLMNWALVQQSFCLSSSGHAVEAREKAWTAINNLTPGTGCKTDTVLANAYQALSGAEMEVNGETAALAAAQKAAEIRLRCLGPNDPRYFEALVTVGKVWESLGQDLRAQEITQQAVTMWERQGGKHSIKWAWAVAFLGDVFASQAKYDSAKWAWEQARKVMAELTGGLYPMLYSVDLKIAKYYASRQEFDKAERLAIEALERCSVPGATNRVGQFAAYDELSTIYLFRNRCDDALQVTSKCEEILDSLGPVNRMLRRDIGTIKMRMAHAFMCQDRRQDALRSAKVGLDLLTRDAWVSQSVMPEFAARSYSLKIDGNAQVYLTILLDTSAMSPEDTQEVAATVLTYKGIHTEIMSQKRAGRIALWNAGGGHTMDGLDHTISDSWIAALKKDSAETVKLFSLVNARARADEMALKDSTMDDSLPRITAQEVAAGLPRGSVLVDYYLYDHQLQPPYTEPRYLALVIRPDSSVQVVPLGGAQKVDSVIEVYRKRMESGPSMERADYRLKASVVRRLVWDPIVPFLRDSETVFIAPDGELNLVSFAGLPQNDGTYLIEKYPFHYFSNVRELLSREVSPSGQGLLAIGPPKFGVLAISGSQTEAKTSGSDCEDILTENLDPLNKTLTDSVANMWNRFSNEKVVLCLNDAATEHRFKTEAPGKKVIFVNTHGFFLEVCEQADRAVWQITEEEPLLRSGFVLQKSDSNGRKEDGIVTAEEVAGMNLKGVDLVVLSACETGLGSIKAGDGVYGLRRAFLLAGARRVVSTLWKVRPDRTAMIMQNLMSQPSISPKRMQEIMVEQIRDLRLHSTERNLMDHPYLWAAFTAAGDWK